MNTVLPPRMISDADAPSPKPAALPRFPVGRPLRAVVVKELRQNLIFFALALVIEFVIYVLLQDFSFRHQQLNILLSTSMTSSIAAAASVCGLLLGIFQSLAHRNFDTWAFTVHRPIARAQLFYGRAIAGLILYFIGAGGPIGGLFIYAMTSHGGDFFIWQYCLPAIAAFLLGLPFYFAGLLVAERQARYYGSAAVPLILPAAAIFITFNVPYFFVAAIASLALAGLLFFAVRRSFVTHGYTLGFSGKPIALGITLLLAYSYLIFIPISGLHIRLFYKGSWYLNNPLINLRLPSYDANTHLELMPDGTPARYVAIYLRYKEKNGSTIHSKVINEFYVDSLGHPRNMPTSDDLGVVGQHTFQRYLSSVYNPYALPGNPYNYLDLNDLVYWYTSANSSDPHNANFYYGVRSRGVFYVYHGARARADQETWVRNYVGVIGANGLVGSAGQAVRFESPLKLPIMATAHSILAVDSPGPSLKTLFQTSPDEMIRSSEINYNFDYSPEEAKRLRTRQTMALFTDKRFLLLDQYTGAVITEFPITPVPEANQIDVTYFPLNSEPANAKSWVVWIYSGAMRSGGFARSSTSVLIENRDASGKLTSSQTMGMPSYSTFRQVTLPPPSAETVRKIRRLDLRDGFWIAMGNPLLFLGGDLAVSPFREPKDIRQTSAIDIWQFNMSAAKWLTMAGTLILWAAGTFAVAVFYRLRRKFAWAVFALACGPAALLVLLSTQSFPRRQRCDSCGKLRLRKEAFSAHCKAPWPEPAHTGTEIFTQAQAAELRV